MGDIVNEGPGRPTRHAIAKVAHISSVVHHAGHVEVEIVFAAREFSEEGGSSASSSSAARCIVQVGKWSFLHLVSVVPPQGKAPHPVTRHAATPEKRKIDPSCILLYHVPVTNNSPFKGSEILGVRAKDTGCCCAQCY